MFLKGRYSRFVTETYGIEDCWRVYATEFANTNFNNNVQNLNFTLPTGDFELSWEQYSNRSGNNNCYIRIGEDIDNSILFGVIDGNQTLGYYIRENGAYSHQTRGSISGSVNTYQNHKVTVQNGIITYNTAELTLPSNTINLDKILSRTVWYAHHKNIKVKLL